MLSSGIVLQGRVGVELCFVVVVGGGAAATRCSGSSSFLVACWFVFAFRSIRR